MGYQRRVHGGTSTQHMMLRTLLAVGIAVATAKMTCPSTPAVLACGMRVTTTASASCADVLGEMKARIAGEYGAWHDPHHNGTYSVESYGGDFSTSRLTGDGKYTDKQIFTLTDQSGSCLIEACSRSQVFSIGDAGTNYCDLKMLFCGSKDGCKPVNHDFAAGKETTSKFSQASVDMGSCLKVSEAQVPVGRGCGFSCKTASDCTSGGCGVCDDGFCQAQATVTELAGNETTLYKISSGECGQATLDSKYASYAEKFAGLSEGSCTTQGYTVADGTQTLKVPVLGDITIAKFKKATVTELTGEKCCVDCVAPEFKAFEVFGGNSCGETCITPVQFAFDHFIEKKLTKATGNTPCKDFFYPMAVKYSSTFIPGGLGNPKAFDLYAPV